MPLEGGNNRNVIAVFSGNKSGIEQEIHKGECAGQSIIAMGTKNMEPEVEVKVEVLMANAT